eukprot:gene2574-2876_t
MVSLRSGATYHYGQVLKRAKSQRQERSSSSSHSIDEREATRRVSKLATTILDGQQHNNAATITNADDVVNLDQEMVTGRVVTTTTKIFISRGILMMLGNQPPPDPVVMKSSMHDLLQQVEVLIKVWGISNGFIVKPELIAKGVTSLLLESCQTRRGRICSRCFGGYIN